MKMLALMMSLFLLNLPGFGQSPYNWEEMVFRAVEQPPEFPGGLAALTTYIQKNVQYPPEARKAGVEGRVFTSFIIDTVGNVSNVRVLKGIGHGCDEEALRVVRSLPRWQPGCMSHKRVNVLYNLPVLFGVNYPTVRKR